MSTFRSPKYLAFVRSLPCSLCGGPADDAHHIVGLPWAQSGMATKPSDALTIPVDRACHNAIHSSPELQQVQPKWLLNTLSAGLRAYPAGPINDALTEAHELVWSKA